MGTASMNCGTDAYGNALTTPLETQEGKLQAKYDSLLKGHPDGIFEITVTGRITSANPACERITGHSSDSLKTMDLTDVFNRMEWHRHPSANMYADDCVYGEGLITHSSGHSVYVQLKRVPIELDNRVIGSHVIARDTTDEQLTKHELEYTKEQIKTIFDTLDVALWAQIWPSKTVIQVSPGSEKIWGIPVERILRDPSSCYENIHPDDVESVREQMNRVHDGIQFIDDYRVIHPNGEVRWIHDRVIPIRGSDGDLKRLIGLAVDITEQKRAEEERIRTRGMLERSEKLHVLGQLAAGIAHEIRNPLTSLMGFVQLIQSGRAGMDDYFDIMASELQRMNTIVGEFLVLSKPHSESMRIHDLKHIIETTLAFLKGEAIMNNTVIQTNFSILPPIVCDESQMKQVFINIIRNALDAMPTGGTITVQTEQTGSNEVTVCVADEGCGIPEDSIAMIGEPFFTTKEDGTGLGMMVTQQIVRSHGGRIEIRSRVDKGTTVSIVLPVSSSS
ncbi:ATP-binding protein [Alicyclobacillus sp. SO9]|uniref:ATP-binding protein n=1 Tax=Alicyclobacillus sp. SO9 TaxID=2665646 RepID=UPI0018E7F73F|nr:ATP-binding protein [Alicyclobacillus sp. SO9]